MSGCALLWSSHKRPMHTKVGLKRDNREPRTNNNHADWPRYLIHFHLKPGDVSQSKAVLCMELFFDLDNLNNPWHLGCMMTAIV